MKKLAEEVLREHKGKSFVGVSTAVAIFNKKGQIFLARRSENARDEHGRWDVCGGGLKWDWTIEKNIRRELEEEFAITSDAPVHFVGLREVFRVDHHNHKTHWLALDYIIILERSEAEKVKINEPHMFDDCGWFSLDALPEPLHSAASVDYIRSIGDKFKAVT